MNFAGPAARDFTPKPDTPARQVGFEPFDSTRAGVYGGPDWIARARQAAD